jgi:hypothetical protein
VEEEILLPEEHLGHNSTATMEEDPAIDSAAANDFVAATMDEYPGTNEVDD